MTTVVINQTGISSRRLWSSNIKKHKIEVAYSDEVIDYKRNEVQVPHITLEYLFVSSYLLLLFWQINILLSRLSKCILSQMFFLYYSCHLSYCLFAQWHSFMDWKTDDSGFPSLVNKLNCFYCILCHRSTWKIQIIFCVCM